MAFTALLSRETITEALKEAEMWKVYEEIELPLVFTLDSMEKWGIRVKGEELKAYGEALAGRIQELEKQIYEQAGEEFNINSPKQLGVILFEKLGIPGGKRRRPDILRRRKFWKSWRRSSRWSMTFWNTGSLQS